MTNSFKISSFMGKTLESTDVSDNQVILYFTDGSMMKFTAIPVAGGDIRYISAELEVQTINNENHS